MAEAILQITKERLIKLLKKAYETGHYGWIELACETAEKITEECIADILKSSKDNSEKTPSRPFLQADSKGHK